ncbi:hypothetical protein Q4Q35_14635 [Flavivirga aquimarina]|uniref:Effector-associated domain-containing protein n=1 Tax=Flavivirga aquimarina TaxID=2027862 RepID=A0ABT8WD62_9FLAO|nr:hypothetical protein [Flavivirga aquimarina]MDO5971041.1 hypothetical protein [Flavivirga aquimarina]
MKINSTNIFQSIKRQIALNNLRGAIQLLEFVDKKSEKIYSNQILKIKADLREYEDIIIKGTENSDELGVRRSKIINHTLILTDRINIENSTYLNEVKLDSDEQEEFNSLFGTQEGKAISKDFKEQNKELKKIKTFNWILLAVIVCISILAYKYMDFSQKKSFKKIKTDLIEINSDINHLTTSYINWINELKRIEGVYCERIDGDKSSLAICKIYVDENDNLRFDGHYYNLSPFKRKGWWNSKYAYFKDNKLEYNYEGWKYNSEEKRDIPIGESNDLGIGSITFYFDGQKFHEAKGTYLSPDWEKKSFSLLKLDASYMQNCNLDPNNYTIKELNEFVRRNGSDLIKE